MKKVTENVRNVLGVLANLPEGAGFAREVLAKVEGKTFNSVNATLAAAAGAGWATKAKAVYEDKMLTKYTITEAGFGADLGAEKFMDIKCRFANIHPDAIVVVATVRAPKSFTYCKTAVASAAPSVGSVPAPSSSNSTSEFGVNCFKMFTILVICDENVLKLCSMLCSSPISANMLSNTQMSVPSAAGIARPQAVIRHKRPTVLSVTVLPPVLGPVTTSVLNVFPSSKDIGTTLSASSRG